jgi:hypothetical protein
MRKTKKIAAIVIAVLLLTLATVRWWRALPGGYTLTRFDENGEFYLNAPGKDDDPGGAVEGTIEKISWDDRFILADVRKLFAGDPSGWYVIDTLNHDIQGPLSEGVLASDRSWGKLYSTAARPR